MKRLNFPAYFLHCVIMLLVAAPSPAIARVLTSDTTWQGVISVSEDILVPKGITLTVKPGTVIHISESESTKTDPEYMSPLTEITIRGRLKVEGAEHFPVRFSTGKQGKQGEWAGIILDGGVATLRSCLLHNAESGVYVIDGTLLLVDSVVTGNRYGVVAQGETSSVTVTRSRISDNEYGLLSLNGASVESRSSDIKSNKKQNRYSSSSSGTRRLKPGKALETGGELSTSTEYTDDVLRGDTIWQGRIVIDGILRVPEGSRLIIMPGAVVEFKKKDTTGSGIGENGILLQGVIIAKGTADHPIIFRSAEKNKAMGDWDAINIMNSNGAQNLIEFCRISEAYRGLHFHFSNVAVKASVLTNNYRCLQFQESAVELNGNTLKANKSGVHARDSVIILEDNLVSDNYVGLNIFRSDLIAKRNTVAGNTREGIKIREGVISLEENLLSNNRFGLMVSDSYYGTFTRNGIIANSEVGFSMRQADNIEVYGNAIAGNGLSGLTLQDSRAYITGNHISDNGERGIGIQSFDGIITRNNIVKNGVYAISLEGKMDVAAPSNWWGVSDVDKIIFDKKNDPSRGSVRYDRVVKGPYPYEWPLKDKPADSLFQFDRGAAAGGTEKK